MSLIAPREPPAARTTAPRYLVLNDGSRAELRPIQTGDRDALVAFHRHLSDKTVYLRYFSPVSLEWRTAARRMADDLVDDPERHRALVIERRAPGSGLRALIGVGRLVIDAARANAEFAITIRDDFQGRGLGGAMLDALIAAAREARLRSLSASVLAENGRMCELCRSRGFHARPGTGDPSALEVTLTLA